MKKRVLATIILMLPYIVNAAPNDDLLLAARIGNVEGIRAALIAGASINALQHPDEKNAYTIAANVATLEELLNAPSFLANNHKLIQCLGSNNIDLPDSSGMTALAYAIENNDLARVQALVKHGVNINGTIIITQNEQEKRLSIPQFAGETILARNNVQYQAALRAGQSPQDAADALVNADPLYDYLMQAYRARNIKQQEYFEAIANNNINGVKAALAPQGAANTHGGANVNGVNADGMSHLQAAYEHGNTSLANFLTHDVSDFLCRNNMVSQISLVNIKNLNGQSTLQSAIAAGNVGSVRSLLGALASLTDLYDGQTLPDFAQSTQPVDSAVGLQIAQEIANAYLFYLVQNGTPEDIIKVLTGQPFTINGITYRCLAPAQTNAKNYSHGATAAMLAAIAGDVEKLTALINQGAEVGPAMVDNNNFNTLMYAAMYGQSSTIQNVLAEGHYSVDAVNARNGNRQTALMLAAQYGALPAILSLTRAGADKNLNDGTAEHTALWYLDNAPYATHMYKYQWDVNNKEWQELPAAQAAERKNEIIEVLRP